MHRLCLSVLLSTGCGTVLIPPDGADAGLTDAESRHAQIEIVLAGNGAGHVTSGDGELSCPEQCAHTYPLGTELTLTAVPNGTSISAGWSLAACEDDSRCTITLDRDISIAVTFELMKYSVRVERTGDGQGNVTSNLSGIDCGSDCSQDWEVGSRIRLTAAPVGASSFGGWSGDCTGTDAICDLVVDGQKSIGAAFDLGLRSLNVSIDGQGAGSVVAQTGAISCPGVCTDSYLAGSSVTLVATPDARSTFAGWDAAECPGTAECTLTMDSARSLSARFDVATHDLTIVQDGPGRGTITSIPSGISCPPQCTASFEHDTVVSLSVVPNESVRFTRWSNACTGTGPMCQVTLTEPSQVSATFERVPLLTVGGAHACALRSDGVLRCWGYNASGQLGLGHTETIGDDELPSSAPPIDIPPTIKGLCAGALHTCALLDGGQVRCWGENFDGQLGLNHNQNIGDDASETHILTNAALNAPATQITCSGEHTCALLTNGDVRCWGRGDSGQLGYGCPANVGDGTVTCASLNDSVPLGAPAVQVDAGSFHTCARLASGAIRCWGNNEYGQLGYGHRNNLGDDPNEVGTDIQIQGTVAQISAGGQHTCALMSDATVRCWGRGSFGQLGNNDVADLLVPPTAPVMLGNVIVSRLVSEDHHNCVVLNTGTVRCWGRGNQGQIGYGSIENLGDEPQDVISDLPLQNMRLAIPGGSHTCGMSTAAEVYCWGRANEGQLGYGNTTPIGQLPGSFAGSGGPVSF